MATIPTPGSELRHVRKTITFTGGAGAGQLSSAITVFSITGRVLLDSLYAYVSTALVSAGAATTSLRFSSNTQDLTNSVPVDTAAADRWMDDNAVAFTKAGEVLGFYSSAQAPRWGVSHDVQMDVVDGGGGADITAGVLVIDCWYRPMTDDGALAGDDIDEDSRTWTWATALSDIAAVPAITASALSGLNWLFALARNKRTQTATTETVYKDDGTTSLATSTKSDDGTTYTRGEYS